MNRNEYLAELGRLLRGLREEDRAEILYDYEEHFRIGRERGKTEGEIAAALGDVRMVAKQFRADYTVKQAETNASAGNIVRAVLAAMSLGFFNLVFILGPFLGLFGVMIGLFAAAAGITLSGLAALAALMFAPVFPSLIAVNIDGVFAAFTCIGITCLGLLFLIGDCYLGKFFYQATVRYLKWNMEIIKK